MNEYFIHLPTLWKRSPVLLTWNLKKPQDYPGNTFDERQIFYWVMFKTRGVSRDFLLFLLSYFSLSDCALYYKKETVFHCHKWIKYWFQCVTVERRDYIIKEEMGVMSVGWFHEKKVKCWKEECLEAQEKSPFRLRQKEQVKDHTYRQTFIKILSAFFSR